jgi:hypothetical protein
MNTAEAIESLKLKFTSGNDIPVTRAVITAAEWDAIHDSLKAGKPDAG